MSKGLTAGLLLILNAGAAYTALDPQLWYVFVSLSFLSGFFVLWAWRNHAYSLKEVLFLAFVFRLLFVGLPPILSDDAFRYIWDGLVQVQGINPYAHLPEDPILSSNHTEYIFQQLNSKSYYTVYPPLSQLVFHTGASVYEYGWIYSYYTIKLLLCLAEAGALLILTRLLSSRNLLLYAWNPLVLIETAGQAHTESLMLLGLVSTVLFLRQGRGGLASFALIGAAMVKIYPVFLLPLLYKKVKLSTIFLSSIPYLGLLVYYYTPDVVNKVNSSLELYIRLFEYNAGLYYTVKQFGYLITGTDISKTLGPLLRNLLLVSTIIIYWTAFRKQWSFEKGAVYILGAILLASTTIHPWYLLGVSLLAVFFHPPSWHWLWVGLISLGTYLFYIEGPYWPFVTLSWSGFVLLAGWKHRESLLQSILAFRGWMKYKSIRSLFPDDLKDKYILDLGAAEGYVGLAFSEHEKAIVELADVIDLNKTQLKLYHYDGDKLPFADNVFDHTILVFVLHHCKNAEDVLEEAARVTRGNLVIAESTYTNTINYKVLYTLDVLANRIRSMREMQIQEEFLHFRTAEEWQEVFKDQEMKVQTIIKKGVLFHKQVYYKIKL